MNIYSIITELRADNSRLAKMAILGRECDNDLLQAVILAALDPFVNYWQKKIPSYAAGKSAPSLSLSQAVAHLYLDLASRKVTGNLAITQLSWILQNCSANDAAVIELIIGRDLKCGVDTSTVNKIWPGLVPKFEVQLAHKDISGIVYPAYAQVKYDGMRCHLENDDGKALLRSRSGKEINLLGIFDNEVVRSMMAGDILDGELLVTAVQPNGRMGIADRKTGNGILNKAVKGTITKEEAERVIFMAWDKVDYTSTILYSVRLARLTKMITGRGLARIVCVDSSIVESAEEARAYYEKCIASKHEGAVIKNMTGKWVPKRTKDLGKLKAVEEADLKVVDWEEGTGKNKGKMGALVCETADGKLRVSVGTGWSDWERDTLTKENTANKILTVKYNQIITDKKKETASLFLPVAIELREDKTVANLLEELK